MKRVPRPSLNPLFILIIFLIAGAIGDMAASRLEARRHVLASARQHFVSALAESRVELAGLAGRVAQDSTLTQNLSWNLAHSVTASLFGKLSKGEMDEVWLVDSRCRVLGQAQLERAYPLTCPLSTTPGDLASGAPAAKKTRSREFFWREAGDLPALGVILPLAGSNDADDGVGADRFVIGMVVLDENWLALAPGLHAAMMAGGLTIGLDEPRRATIWRDGVTKDGRGIASLTSNATFDRAILPALGRPHGIVNPLFWPTILAGLALSLLALGRERRRQAVATRLPAGLIERCRDLTMAKAKSSLASDIDAPPIGRGSVALPPEAEALILGALRDRNKQIDMSAAHIDELRAIARERDLRLQALSTRLAESAELDTLAIQLARTADTFLSQADRLSSGAEDLTDALGGPIAEQSKLFFNVMMEWQEGITERGARKFIRGLSETAGTRVGTSLLDEQVIALAMMAGEVSDLAVDASIKSHALVESATALARIAALWRGLAGRHDKVDGSVRVPASPPLEAFRDALHTALDLLRLDPQYRPLLLADKLDFLDRPGTSRSEWPRVPTSVWTTALYHVFLSLADRVGKSALTLGLRLRDDKDRTLLVAQATDQENGERPAAELITKRSSAAKTGERSAYHLEIARAVLVPYDVGISLLPALDGPFPIAFTWSTVDGGSKAYADQRRRQLPMDLPQGPLELPQKDQRI